MCIRDRISRSYSKRSRNNDGSKESLLEESLIKAEKALEDFALEFEEQKKEIKTYQENFQELGKQDAIKEIVVASEFFELTNNNILSRKKLSLLLHLQHNTPKLQQKNNKISKGLFQRLRRMVMVSQI